MSPRGQHSSEAGVYHVEYMAESGSHLPRVGLLHERTGIPAFLLYLQGAKQVQTRVVHAAADLESEALRYASDFDKRAWKSLRAFFDVGGTTALVVTLPLSDSLDNALSDMCGEDRGLRHRTGFHVLKHLTESCDVVAVPQASLLLEPHEHKIFFHQMIEQLQSLNHYFFLIDFPRKLSRQAVYDWLKGTILPDAAAFYPWLRQDTEWVAPSLLAAGAIQVSDREHGVAELPSNRPLSTKAVPILKLLPAEVDEALDHRLTLFHPFLDGSLRLWGGRTLADPMDLDNRFLSARRTLHAIREAVVKVCEPFVLEPMNDSLPNLVDVALQSAFHPLRRLFDRDARKPFSSEISITQKGTEDVLQVNVSFAIPFTVDRVALKLGIGG